MATWLCMGRVALGASMVVLPGTSRLWLGQDARRPVSRMFARMLGARDVALGVGGYLALDDPPVAATWLRMAAAADAVDAAATLLAARHLPKRGVLAVLAAAGGGAVAGFTLAQRAEAK